jgi:L-lactate dehydrogenase (cytochrome)
LDIPWVRPLPLSLPASSLTLQSHLSLTGEENITHGLAATCLIQIVSSNASLSFATIIASAAPSQTLFFQLYKHANDELAEKRVREVEALGYKAIWLTVDALVPGNREQDIRMPWALEEGEGEGRGDASRTSVWEADMDDGLSEDVNFNGTAGALVKNDDRDMTWEKASTWLVLAAR